MYFSRRSILRRLELRNGQALVRQRDNWLRLRELVNRLKTLELQHVIAAGGASTARDVELSNAMTRMYQVRDLQPIFFAPNCFDLSALQRPDAPYPDAATTVVEDLIAGRQLYAVDVPLSLLPPGTSNLRQTPRRPGAPSSSPALVNHFQINAGARAAPEIRLS